MKLIIAGSRTLTLAPGTLREILIDGFKITEIEEVVTGKAKGIDQSGEWFADREGITIKPFPCTDEDWKTYGKGAGHRRNRQMGDYADSLLLIWDGESAGSKGMKEYMLKLDKPVYEVILKVHNA